MSIISAMGTVIFWAAWLAIFCFLKLTTRQQRQRWQYLFWIWATISITVSITLNYMDQMYLTVV